MQVMESRLTIYSMEHSDTQVASYCPLSVCFAQYAV